MLSHFSRVRLCVTPEMAAHQAPRPWDSPGKNTGVGCHFLLQCMKVRSESEVAQSCPTPSDPMDCNPPGFSIHGIFQVSVLEWGAIVFSESTKYIDIKGKIDEKLTWEIEKAFSLPRSMVSTLFSVKGQLLWRYCLLPATYLCLCSMKADKGTVF